VDALRAKYAAQLWLTQIAKRIDDLHYQNFHVPVLQHQERVLREMDCNQQYQVGHVYADADYVDAQEQFTYTTPTWPLREELTAQQVQQLQAVNSAVRTALQHKSITLLQLRRALTPQQLQEFAASLVEVHEPSEIMYGGGMPEPLHAYNSALRAADFAWSRFEAQPTTPRHKARSVKKAGANTEDRAISLYEHAIECLADIFTSAQRGDYGAGMYGELQTWMDRTVEFDSLMPNAVDTNPYAMPRVRGSKSRYAQDSDIHVGALATAAGRDSTIGLEGGLGKVRLGRSYTPLFSVLGASDPFGTTGARVS
jgi:hypothetical protein